MISKILIDAIRKVELFQDLTPMQITEIARQADRVMIPKGEVIARVGEAADASLLLIDGEVERIGGLFARRGQTILPGTLIGEMAMFTEFEYSATFIARGPVKALRIDRNVMLAQMADDPALADVFVHKIASRLRTVAIELAQVGGIDLDEDIATAPASETRADADAGRSLAPV